MSAPTPIVVGGIELSPVDAPPEPTPRGASKELSWEAAAGFMMAHPGQWFVLDIGRPAASSYVTRLTEREGFDAVWRSGVIFGRFGGDA